MCLPLLSSLTLFSSLNVSLDKAVVDTVYTELSMPNFSPHSHEIFQFDQEIHDFTKGLIENSDIDRSDLVGIVNLIRAHRGLPPLSVSAELCDQALSYSKDMADYDFFGPQEVSFLPEQRIVAAGWYGDSWMRVISSLMGVAARQAAILRIDVKEIGFGMYCAASDESNVRMLEGTYLEGAEETPEFAGPFMCYYTVIVATACQ